MSLGAHFYQLLFMAVIATITTATTTSMTHYLLSRPWCIQFEADGKHKILYGTHLCHSCLLTEATAQFSAKGLILEN